MHLQNTTTQQGQLSGISPSGNQRGNSWSFTLNCPSTPCRDIHPTGTETLTSRRGPTFQARPDGPLSVRPHGPERACIHHADGRCTHVLAVDTDGGDCTLRYRACERTSFQFIPPAETGASFEEEPVQTAACGTLLEMLSTGLRSTRAQQTLPAPLHNMLHTLTGSTTERLASPRDVAGSHICILVVAHERDRLFGANWNAHNSVQWTGHAVGRATTLNSTAASAGHQMGTLRRNACECARA